jgi:hypothetical protein
MNDMYKEENEKDRLLLSPSQPEKKIDDSKYEGKEKILQ